MSPDIPKVDILYPMSSEQYAVWCALTAQVCTSLKAPRYNPGIADRGAGP